MPEDLCYATVRKTREKDRVVQVVCTVVFDDAFPHADGSIGLFGFDAGDPALGISMAAFSPPLFRDVMTYCGFQRVSDYTYRGILEHARLVKSQGAGAGAPVLDEALLIQGTVRTSAQAVTLEKFLRITSASETPEPPASEHAVELRGAAEAVLVRRRIALDEDSEALVGEDAVSSFDAVLPWAEGTLRIVILHGTREIASRTVSRNAPAVRLTAPNGPGSVITDRRNIIVRWEGADADRDTLEYTLLYSTDRGRMWEPIDTGLAGPELRVPLATLRGGREVLFRIMASDGVNTSSDVQDAPITLPNQTPAARILAPMNGAKIAGDQVVILDGSALDPEDGPLDGAALEWSLDTEGVVGSGARLSLSGLLPGAYRATLTALDSSGGAGEATVRFEVTPIQAVASTVAPASALPGSVVPLDGTGSFGNGMLAFRWRIASGPAGGDGSIESAESALARFTATVLGGYGVELLVVDEAGASGVATVFIDVREGTAFLRGETTGDGRVDISDPVRILAFLFTGGARPDCLDAADANDDERADVSDAVALLGYLFLGAPAPLLPFPRCGMSPTPQALSCDRSSCP